MEVKLPFMDDFRTFLMSDSGELDEMCNWLYVERAVKLLSLTKESNLIPI